MNNKSYLEYNLPKWLDESIKINYPASIDKNNSLWDCHYCELQSDINVAEVEGEITSEQAWYLRGKYLGITKGD